MDLSFYAGKKVFITGHTGFKGSWLCKVLTLHGAKVMGYALKPNSTPNLFEIADIESTIIHIIGDIRDLEYLKKAINEFEPEIVLHLAAQPLVRESYLDPVSTYETNIMGTVNICEAIRGCKSVKSFVNVTTDKVYENKEWEWGYRENDRLNGFDPYSNSKSCSELVTSSYINSFYSQNKNLGVSTCRAGNVIGGGDFAKDRIIPDCIRAAHSKKDIIVRHPLSIRPYQHVLEPVIAYLYIAMMMYQDKVYSGSYNIGPDDNDCIKTGELTTLFCEKWGEGLKWINKGEENAVHEAKYLKLDISKVKQTFGLKPRWRVSEAVEKTIEWSKAYYSGKNIDVLMKQQILLFLED
ncbi:CDP-glucose 4,6-dehydratase [Psychrobacillus psychrodurans]|uniref:CDP-glucose 4,6-dehydratase n=1 Tax=Psychrobacillus psychrodurans TaxID=126157 RepID=A0A9X3L9J1_9BACI|nr:CDP-glucose 4,6-dehydratase [Psychrobacillus psychrodurans]MCZ8532014.1 CDP-glucose 4,6-dehydratase [Psychrobacillus psychrodurans]